MKFTRPLEASQCALDLALLGKVMVPASFTHWVIGGRGAANVDVCSASAGQPLAFRLDLLLNNLVQLADLPRDNVPCKHLGCEIERFSLQ